MVQAQSFLKASLNAGRELLRPLTSAGVPQSTDAHAVADQAANHQSQALVPIRSIGPSERERVVNHLIALDAHDRYLRFGYVATDEHIQRYAAGLDFERDDIFGIYNRKLELIAMAHLAFSVDPQRASCAEFGVSVLPHARGRGYGGRLFDRAVMHSRNQGVTMIYIHALSENTNMLNIVRKAGASVVRDGSESEAHLTLPPATLDTHFSEIVEHQFAEADYVVKTQSKRLHDFIAGVQEVRQGVRDARHKASD